MHNIALNDKETKKVCNAKNPNVQIDKLIEHIVRTIFDILTTKPFIKISDIGNYKKGHSEHSANSFMV